MFEVKHSIATYEHWRVYKEWHLNYTPETKYDFGKYVMCNYPECIEISIRPDGRIFKFNSEADYTFFLLRVS
jgi:hypothetical protein